MMVISTTIMQTTVVESLQISALAEAGYGKNVLVNSSVPLKIRKDWFFLGEYSPKVNDGCYAWTLLAWFRVLTCLQIS